MEFRELEELDKFLNIDETNSVHENSFLRLILK